MAHAPTDIRARIVSIIADTLSIDKARITDNSTLPNLGADSLDLVEIIIKIEQEFHIEIDDDQAAKLHSFADVLSYVQKQVEKTA